MIINLTQHFATKEQRDGGVVEPSPEVKVKIKELLTFTTPPDQYTLAETARELADIALASKTDIAMIGGAGYLMAPLEEALRIRDITPAYSFSQRVSTEKQDTDGSVKKVMVFRHLDMVPVPCGYDHATRLRSGE